MSRFLLLALIGFCSTAHGEVLVELVPDPPGPYVGGETITVHVWLHSQVNFDAQFDFIQLDFSDSHPQLGFSSPFVFDFGSLNAPHGYVEGTVAEGQYVLGPAALPALFAYNGWSISCYPCAGTFFVLPTLGAFHIGEVEVHVPSGRGVYRLDAMNRSAPETHAGARMNVDDDITGPPMDWTAYTGELIGGQKTLVVSGPIPAVSSWGIGAMTCLLATAGTLLLRRNRVPIGGDARSAAMICAEVAGRKFP